MDLPEITILHIIYQQKAYEGHAKDYEFSGTSMREHWPSGYEDTRDSQTAGVDDNAGAGLGRGGPRRPPSTGGIRADATNSHLRLSWQGSHRKSRL